ncbi:TlpA family protein disulfide reductase [Methylomonas methanica]|uniref:Redoxin domain protein n=1 Tax=Methylomonas methanica (strain DSM 25384 / MC09) TaxID=857087 RepID=F9ZZ68_METMM|nr:TlpA disulfide reductase family protein [Methylomonas methanica]AEG01094.1 Redoxin domain protein [Methylomonas methanica MC09]
MKYRLLIRILLLLFFWLTEAYALEVGQKVPACRIFAYPNKVPIDFQSLRGQVVYIDFWASWCGPCAKSFPFMNSLHDQLKQNGLHIVAVNVDEDVADAEHFLQDLPASFQLGRDEESQCAKIFDVQAMPSTYLVDRKGIVRYVHLGFRGSEVETLRSQVEELLHESP